MILGRTIGVYMVGMLSYPGEGKGRRRPPIKLARFRKVSDVFCERYIYYGEADEPTEVDSRTQTSGQAV